MELGDPKALLTSMQAQAEAVREVDLTAAGAAELLDLTRELERTRRAVDAATLALTEELRTSGAWAVDGHLHATACVKHLGRLPGSDAAARVKAAAVLRRLPLVRKSYEEGLIPTAHVEALGRLARNPRVAWAFESCDEYFREKACELDHAAFVAELRRWEQLADADGAESRADRAHRRRSASIREDLEGNHHLQAREGALRGMVLATILAAFEQAEHEADWAEARGRLGESTTADDLQRTAAQRRADALFTIFRLAAANPDLPVPVPVVSVVVDEETFATELARQAADHPGARPDHEPSRLDGVVCQGTDGTQLTPAEVLMAAMVGLVRRVVVDRSGNVVNHGRAKRLFTGASRDAVLLREAIRDPAGARCCWYGCDRPGWRCQIDHREPAARGGPTDHANGDPLCGRHNRLKETGFRPRRSSDGSFLIHRPDGTLITRSA